MIKNWIKLIRVNPEKDSKKMNSFRARKLV
jgi:hypothetical protein